MSQSSRRRSADVALLIIPPRGVGHRGDINGFGFGEIARALGISRSHIGMIVSGKRRPSVTLATRLAQVLRVDVGTLIADLNHRRPSK